MKYLIIAFGLLLPVCVYSQDTTVSKYASHVEPGVKKETYFNKKRITAIALTILTGPLGGHRIYLGTEPGVPFFYVFTLGGGLGILPLIDLYHILFKKNLLPMVDNYRILGWTEYSP